MRYLVDGERKPLAAHRCLYCLRDRVRANWLSAEEVALERVSVRRQRPTEPAKRLLGVSRRAGPSEIRKCSPESQHRRCCSTCFRGCNDWLSYPHFSRFQSRAVASPVVYQKYLVFSSSQYSPRERFPNWGRTPLEGRFQCRLNHSLAGGFVLLQRRACCRSTGQPSQSACRRNATGGHRRRTAGPAGRRTSRRCRGYCVVKREISSVTNL